VAGTRAAGGTAVTGHRLVLIACLATALALPAPLGIAPARAEGQDAAVNGVFTAVSDGQWATTNESFHDEATVVSTWTITSDCGTFQDCTGTVTSDQGWSAAVVYQSGRWRAVRMIENWETCPDGTTAAGEQSFTFWPARTDAPDRHDRLLGWDQTVGRTGACGINRSLNVRMPLRLTRIG